MKSARQLVDELVTDSRMKFRLPSGEPPRTPIDNRKFRFGKGRKTKVPFNVARQHR